METIYNIVISVISVFAGGLITYFAAKCYYEKASDDLTVESKKLRLLSEMILYKLQHPDAITETIFNEEGIVVGLKVQMKGTVNAGSEMKGNISNK